MIRIYMNIRMNCGDVSKNNDTHLSVPVTSGFYIKMFRIRKKLRVIAIARNTVKNKPPGFPDGLFYLQFLISSPTWNLQCMYRSWGLHSQAGSV